MSSGIFALVVSALAVACLYLSWQKRLPSQRWLMPLGWLLAVVALGAWIVRHGAEYGAVYGLLLVPLMAWLAVLYNLEIKRKKQRVAENINFVVPNTRTMLRHLALFVIAIPLSAVAATYFTVGISALLPLSVVNSMVLIVYLVPIVWALAVYWACADTNRYRPALWISAAGLVGAAIVHL